MTSIARVSRTLRTLFELDAVELGEHYGVRQRTMTFTQLVYVLVLGWWKQPAAGPSALTRFAGSLGVRLCKQDLDCHWTERTADWLLALLRRAVALGVCANAVKLPLLQQFTAVLIEDGSSISLPSVLKRVWGGCGGSPTQGGTDPKTQAGLKITVRLDLLKGHLNGPHLQEGRRHERSLVLREEVMLPGSLWIADLGYWTLKWLRSLAEHGVFFLMRYKAGIVLLLDNELIDPLAFLPHAHAHRLAPLLTLAPTKLP